MRSLVFVLTTTVLLAACRGGDEQQNNEAWLDPAASQTTTMPAPATTTDTHAGTTVLVTLNDGSIAAGETAIPPGPAVLTVANAGKEVHSLHVEGPGVNAALDSNLDANGSGTVNVTFQRGSYDLYCPILDHRQTETRTLTIQ